MALDRLGLIKTSLLDFPGRVAAVLFTPGCNFRCPWCQNPDLVLPPYDPDLVPVEEILEFLARRKKVLGGVAITGGEPLYHQDLGVLLAAVKGLGYAVKLDTNGSYPRRLEKLDEGWVDYVAMDVKASPSRYARSAGIPVQTEKLRQSLELLRSRWAGRCEARLTWVPALNRIDELEELAGFIGAGIPLMVTGFRPGRTVDRKMETARAATPEEIQKVVRILNDIGVEACSR